MSKKSVFTCETCSALYVCLKYFQEHRKKHATQEGKTVYPCSYCQIVHTSENESHLHRVSHKNEPPHCCEVCQEIGISEEVVLGSRRSIGTATDFHVYNISLDKPLVNEAENDDDEEDLEEEEEEEEEAGADDEEEDEDDGSEDEEADEEAPQQPIVNILIHASQSIQNNTKNYQKPSRPSRSTGKGKGNRKARLTIDGDARRKFSCCHCGKSFKTKSHLQRHILTHTGEKPYQCNRCTCRFNQSSSLRNHVIAIHTKQYPHTCNHCGKGFLMPAVLHKHLQTSECGKITNQIVEGL